MSAGVRSIVLGTAGHIDHGKTTLVKALTGVDTDRLPEEKRRGITIELGFAAWTLADDLEASVVDVPGHESFVRTMVSGAGGIDGLILVISAEDGVMPQTREHLRVCELLGVARAVVALTMVDRLEGDPDAIELATDDVREALEHGRFADAPIVPCSGKTGEGIDELRAAILQMAQSLPRRPSKGDALLPIDRVFTIKGHGTVVTGTLLSGAIDPRREDTLTLLPVGARREPQTVRARGLQVRGDEARKSVAGTRTALNIAGLAVTDLSRGDVLTAGPLVGRSDTLHAEIDFLPHASRPLKAGSSVQLCAGTAHVVARLDPLLSIESVPDGDDIIEATELLPPGSRGVVRMRLDHPIPVWWGQRIILRAFSDPSAAHEGLTVAGGTVLDPAPSSGRGQRKRWRTLAQTLRRPEPEPRIQGLIADAGTMGITTEVLSVRAGIPNVGSVVARLRQRGHELLELSGGLWLDATQLDPLIPLTAATVDEFHDAHPMQPGMSRAALEGALPGRVNPAVANAAVEAAIERELLRVADGQGALARPGRGVISAEDLPEPMRLVLDLYRRGGTTPPTLKDLEGATGMSSKQILEIASLLQRSELLVRVASDLSYAPSAHAELLADAKTHLRAHGRLDVQALKAITGLSRKFAVPFMEHLDRLGVTIRRGDERVPGPKA